MVAYSFKKRFVEPIQQGTKRQTIRGRGKRRHARPGDMLQLYYGMRTKHCSKIVDDPQCKAQREVIIVFEKGEITDIHVNGQSVEDLDAFARADGFEDISDMQHFWHDNHACSDYTGRNYPLVLVEW